MSLPKEDMLNMRRKQAIDTIIMTMAGRISEEYVTDDISSGAAMDIQQATQLAKSMVMHWGMSEKLGNVLYGDSPEYVFLGRDMMRTKDYSEQTAQEIDAEVKRIIEEAFNTAKELIATNRDRLEIIANALLEHETLDGAQVEEIVRTGVFTPPPAPPTATGPMLGAPPARPCRRPRPNPCRPSCLDWARRPRRRCKQSSGRFFQILQVLGQKPGHVLEPRHVVGIHRHQRLVRLQAGAGDFLAGGVGWLWSGGLNFPRQLQGPGAHFKETRGSEVLQKFRHPRVGVEQFHTGAGGRAVGTIHLEPESG